MRERIFAMLFPFTVVIGDVAPFFAFLFCLWIVYKAGGLLWAVVGFFLCPITMLLAPIYATFAWNMWFSIPLCYGLYALGLLLLKHGPKLIMTKEARAASDQ